MALSVKESQVERGRNLLKAQLLQRMGSGTSAICHDIGKHVHLYERRIPLAELFSRIDDVRADDVKRALMKYTYDRCPAVACIGPIEAFPDYSEIRAHTWLLRY